MTVTPLVKVLREGQPLTHQPQWLWALAWERFWGCVLVRNQCHTQCRIPVGLGFHTVVSVPQSHPAHKGAQWSREVAQQIKVPSSRAWWPQDPLYIKVEGENRFYEVVLWPPRSCYGTQAPPHPRWHHQYSGFKKVLESFAWLWVGKLLKYRKTPRLPIHIRKGYATCSLRKEGAAVCRSHSYVRGFTVE